ncbi:uncharacterized protein isoform X3 [Choristoneura fumiferana]|uniref:uncharacterized protein isoform X3 n=1 Tax=Choristoneura fumiferana TaxID=7141 RepID=UPI003D15B791
MCGAINCTHIIAVIGPLLLPLCTIMNGELRNFRKHFENLCSTHERAALLGRWRCLLGARQLLCEPETAPGECWAHGPSRSRARRCRRPTPRPQPPPAPPPPPPTLCSAQGRTVTDSYAI